MNQQINKINLKWKTDKALDFLQSKKKINIIAGGVRSSKTFTGAVKGILYTLQNSNCRGLCIAPTYPMVRDVLIYTYKLILNSFGVICGKHYQYIKSEHMFIFINGSVIYFRSADKDDALQGLTIDWAHIDEAARCKKQIYFTVIDRVSKSPLGISQVFLTSTPTGQNYLFDEYEKYRSNDNYFSTTIYTEEAGLVSQENIEFARQNMDRRTFRQQYYADFVSWAGLVYDEFTDLNITNCQYNPNLPVYVGLDFGWNDPATAIYCQYDSMLDTWYIIGEFSHSRVMPETMARYLRGEEEVFIGGEVFKAPIPYQYVERFISGHEGLSSKQEAGGQSMKKIFRNYDINLEAKYHKIFDRIMSVRSKILLADNSIRFFLDKQCSGLRKDLFSYHYPEKDGIIAGELPDDSIDNHQYSHRIHALEYVIDTITPIKKIQEWRI